MILHTRANAGTPGGNILMLFPAGLMAETMNPKNPREKALPGRISLGKNLMEIARFLMFFRADSDKIVLNHTPPGGLTTWRSGLSIG
jgi:hypothetical protein